MATRNIPLSQGKYALIDKDDFKKVSQHKWYVSHFGYAVTTFKSKKIWMHRVIMDDPEQKEVDHINMDKLDNRKSNLRIATSGQNNFNRAKKLGKYSSNFKGVYKHNIGKGYWRANISINYKQIFLGLFKTEEEAAKAYNKAAKKYFGEFAFINKGGALT